MLVGELRLACVIARQAALREWITREVFPGPDMQDDATPGQYARRTSGTSYHLVGSYRMGEADASAFPLQVGVNLILTVVMLTERCAGWMLGGYSSPCHSSNQSCCRLSKSTMMIRAIRPQSR